MGDRSGMSISADCPSDETLNRGPMALLLRRQYEFPLGIDIVQFSFSFNLSGLIGFVGRVSDFGSKALGFDSRRLHCQF